MNKNKAKIIAEIDIEKEFANIQIDGNQKLLFVIIASVLVQIADSSHIPDNKIALILADTVSLLRNGGIRARVDVDEMKRQMDGPGMER